MDDIREVVLYFKKGCKLVPFDIAKAISDRFKDIGSPGIFNPENSQPLVVFKENPEMMITVTLMTVNLVVSEKYFKKLDTVIFDLIDLFSDLEIEFTKIGLIYSMFLSEKNKDIFKNKLLKTDNIPEDIEDYNVSFYRKLDFKDTKLNCWERLITNSDQFNELLIQFDFNTLSDEEVNIDMKFIKELLKVSNNYIEERTND